MKKKQVMIRVGCGLSAILAIIAMVQGFSAIATGGCAFEDQSTPRAIRTLATNCATETSVQGFEGRINELLEQYGPPDSAISEESLSRIEMEFMLAHAAIPTQFFGLERGIIVLPLLFIPLLISALLLGIAFNADDIWKNRPPSIFQISLDAAKQVYRES